MKPKELLAWLAAGLALRGALSLGRFLWYDEAFTGLLARQPLAQLLAGTAADVHPPLYYLLVWPLMQLIDLFDLPLWLVRLPSLLAGGLSIWLMSKAAPALGFDARLTRVLVAVTAITPAQVWYGAEARQYALLTALFLAAAWALGARRWHWFTLAAMGLVYTHNYGLFYAAALGLLGLARNWRDVGRIARAGGITAAAWSPWAVVMARQIAEIDGRYWVEPFGHGPLITTLVVLLAGFELPPAALMAGGALGLTLLMVALTRRPPLALVMLALAPMILAALAALGVTNLWLFRGLIPAQPFLVGLALWPFVRGWDWRPARWLAVALVGPLLAWSLIAQQATGQDATDDSAGAALAVIRAGWQEGDLLVHMTDGSAVHLGLKAPDLPQVKLAECAHTVGALTDASRLALGMELVERIPATSRRVWLLGGIGINTPVCMIESLERMTDGREPVFTHPFKDYFVDEIYILEQ